MEVIVVVDGYFICNEHLMVYVDIALYNLQSKFAICKNGANVTNPRSTQIMAMKG